jgi:cobyrinic acid a,c-diamide synthase
MTRIVVSAAGTGAGKTLVARALCVALSAAGRRVQPYKIGPDYIDARLYEACCGRAAYNVDLWLDGPQRLLRHVRATLGDADVAVFEGMMGLFDGDSEGETSTAAVARLLDAAVLLVLDGWTASQTLAAVALGLRNYDPALRVVGAIVNRCAGGSHERAVRRACERAGVPVLAVIPHDPALQVPERALGLVPQAALDVTAAVAELGRRLGAQLDVDALAPRVPVGARPPASHARRRTRIAVAEDEAFWFTYRETLDALAHAGAEIVPFSPLRDARLPTNVDGLWIGGGYPELHVEQLAENASMRRSVREAIDAGMPTYAECGGHMYLGEWIETERGRLPMCGAVDGGTSMLAAKLTIGYRTVHVRCDTVLDEAGDEVRAYAFHYAAGRAPEDPVYRVADGEDEGVARGALLSSFLHRHFVPGDAAIARFVERCAQR